MKKKLTLTIQEDIIKSAKREARRRGISVSQMFEEVIAQGTVNEIETESQRAAKRLLKTLKNAESSDPKNDKQLIREHVKRKFT
ncbi:MAG TPA: DUF6364 family protein [Balneolaceae bacterium]|nr:DUF6364 family protein [Balneolaceae bacterium]